jgi:uncharacterized protein YukJ
VSHKRKHHEASHPQDPHRTQRSHRPRHANRINRGNFPRPSRAGEKVNYHVLKCRPVLTHNSPQIQHDHLQVLLENDSGTRYWMTINIRSGQDQVLYLIDEVFHHPITQRILDAQLPQGFTALEKKPGGLALDYIRDNVVDLRSMDQLQPTGDPDDEGIADMLTTQIVNVVRAPDARMFVFSSRFDDGARFSSFDLDVGIHDIHMNQGSRGITPAATVYSRMVPCSRFIRQNDAGPRYS